MAGNGVIWKKPIILTFVRHYLPGFQAGGPIRTIASMVERLGDDFDFRIVTMDRDIGNADPYPDIEKNIWVPCGKAVVSYVSPYNFGMRKIAELVKATPHDVIYLNSFFDPFFTQRVLVNRRLGRLGDRPIVIAPRGEFSEGALRFKFVKKKLFIKGAKLLKLYDGLIWQGSSLQEVEDIRRVIAVGEKVTGIISKAGNLMSITRPKSVSVNVPLRRRSGSLRVCFLSRISPKKNLDFALRILAMVRVPVKFSIYGPIEDRGYWDKCRALISKLPDNVEVTHEGAVEPNEILSTLVENELFLLPTRGENFGHVIHEALRAGLPTLISDQTPWTRLAEKKVGWDLPLGDAGLFASRIEEVAGWSDSEHLQWALRAQQFAEEIANDSAMLEENRRLFSDAIG